MSYPTGVNIQILTSADLLFGQEQDNDVWCPMLSISSTLLSGFDTDETVIPLLDGSLSG